MKTLKLLLIFTLTALAAYSSYNPENKETVHPPDREDTFIGPSGQISVACVASRSGRMQAIMNPQIHYIRYLYVQAPISGKPLKKSEYSISMI